MIEEPYRWVEAIANRRDYIEHQLASGSPIVCMSFCEGILLFTLGRERQKLFEIYDRIAMGVIGHPADIERLRMAALEVASTEGFTRSTADVSLRRLANYSLSPALKTAFEQIYGAPYLARMLMAELGSGHEPNLFVRLDYDGAMHTNGGSLHKAFEDFAVVSGISTSAHAMEEFLRGKELVGFSMAEALRTAFDAWIVGHLTREEKQPPTREKIEEERKTQLASSVIEAAILVRTAGRVSTYRSLAPKEIEALLQSA